MKKDLNYLFNDVSLYTKETFEILESHKENSSDDISYNIRHDNLDSFLEYIGCNNERLVSYCHLCKKEFPFKIDKRIYHYNSSGNFVYTEYINIANTSNPLHRNVFDTRLSLNGYIEGKTESIEPDELYNHKIWYIQYCFSCTNDNQHNYMMMISVELKDTKLIVRKIGQNPSMLTVKGFDFDIYKKQLEKINAYNDYKKADLSYTDHFYVGAYAYLRRIFEKMINHFTNGINLKDNHMDTKIQASKEKFDPRIRDMLKNLYEILSISIHELDEEQSKEYYTYLKAIIDIQLEYQKTEEDKDRQTKELESTLNKIKNGIKIKNNT